MNPFETLVISLLGDISHYTKSCEEAVRVSRSASHRMASSTTDAMRTMQNAVNRYAAALATTITLTTAVGTVTQSIALAAHWETIDTSFKSIIGDAQLAEKTLLSLRKFADWSPFSTTEVLDAGKVMLAMGTSAGKLTEQMMVVGEVASALGQDFKQLAIIHGRNLVQGRMYLYDINQYLNHAIPVWEGLGRIFNIDEKSMEGKAALRQMVEDGLITAQHIDQIFRDMAKEGGRFYKGMEKQAKTLKGLFETMKSEIQNALREIGFELIKNLDLKYLVNQAQELSQTLGKMFVTLDPWTQRFLIFTAVAFSGLIAMTVALRALRAMLIYATFGLSKLFILSGLVTLGLASWATEFGTIRDILEVIKGYVQLIEYAFRSPEALKNFKNDLADLTSGIKGFIEKNQELVLKLTILVGVVASVILVYMILSKLMVFHIALLTLQAIKWTIVTAVLLIYKLILLTVTAVTYVYIAALVVLKAIWSAIVFLTSAASLSTGAWAVIVLIAKVAVWLFNAALLVTNISLLSFLIITGKIILVLGALIVVLGAVAAVLAIVGSTAYAVFKTIDSVLDLLLQIHSDSGPIPHIISMFSDWLALIKDITTAVRYDMPLAWKFVEASIRLISAQIRDMWSDEKGLWNFLREGFRIVTDLAAKQFELSFSIAISTILNKFISGLNTIYAAMIAPFNAIPGVNLKPMTIDPIAVGVFDKAADKVEAESKQKLRKLIDEFKVDESLETKMAKKALQELRAELSAHQNMIVDAAKSITEAIMRPIVQAGDNVADSWTKAARSVEKFEAALVGSAEASKRIQDYTSMLGRQEKWLPTAPMPHNAIDPRIVPVMPRWIRPNPLDEHELRQFYAPPPEPKRIGIPQAQQPPMAGDPDRERMFRLWERIANASEAIEKKPPIVLKQANL